MSSGVNDSTRVVSTPRVVEELEPPLEGRDEVDAISERNPRMRVERDRRRRQPRLDRGLQHRDMTAMDPVEGADRNCPGLPLDLRRRVGDPHTRTGFSRRRASSTSITRSSSASST